MHMRQLTRMPQHASVQSPTWVFGQPCQAASDIPVLQSSAPQCGVCHRTETAGIRHGDSERVSTRAVLELLQTLKPSLADVWVESRAGVEASCTSTVALLDPPPLEPLATLDLGPLPSPTFATPHFLLLIPVAVKQFLLHKSNQNEIRGRQARPNHQNSYIGAHKTNCDASAARDWAEQISNKLSPSWPHPRCT